MNCDNAGVAENIKKCNVIKSSVWSCTTVSHLYGSRRRWSRPSPSTLHCMVVLRISATVLHLAAFSETNPQWLCWGLSEKKRLPFPDKK